MMIANGHYANLWKQQFGDDDLTSLITPALEFVKDSI
ncbi:hypothetical protein FHT21_004666 [Pedobacter sp. SG908]|nr:hypothetical protein [Pedobacter sp. SG908]NMN39544.1 hypothetical protein [Pedobacter sp. SG918]